MSLQIVRIATAVPEHAMSQAEAVELGSQICCRNADDARLLSVLYRRSGVRNRHTVVPHQIAYELVGRERESTGNVAVAQQLGPTTRERMEMYRTHAGPLAIAAAQSALADSPVQAHDLTHLITVSCTGFLAPGVDIALMTTLGLPPTIERTHVGFMGCHGAINGLRVASALVNANPANKVLLCAFELCSLHYRFNWEPERMVGNAIFADGAAAVIATAGDLENQDAWHVTGTGSCLIPDSQDAMSWDVGDHGFEMNLSTRVPDVICQHLASWLAAWLAKHRLTIGDIRSWAVHPGGPRILAAVEEALGLDAQATAVSRQVLSEHGNMSSPTVLFILDELRRQNAPRPCVALGFGPGLVAETALIE